MEDRSSSNIDTTGVSDADVTVETADKLESKLKDLITKDKHVRENVYVEIPTVRLDNIIVSNAEVHEEIDNDWERQRKLFQESNIPISLKFDDVDGDYVQFKRDAQ